jgi:hydroxymethylglutaryl-CoA lyase
MKIIECPRDAMQGLQDFVPTKDKIRYINALLKVGFDTIDFGSFVSLKAIPQMRDTAEVLAGLELTKTSSKLLAIVANVRGAQAALAHQQIDYLGFPLSISETFQQRNTNKSIDEAMSALAEINSLVQKAKKELVVYISMGFGNPYGEIYDTETVVGFVKKLQEMKIGIVSLADTIGIASASVIHSVFTKVLATFPELEIGAHFHSTPQTAREKIEAAWQAGCKRMDSAIGGMGGCPMAKEDLTGNIDTSIVIDFCKDLKINHQLDLAAYQEAFKIKQSLFN